MIVFYASLSSFVRPVLSEGEEEEGKGEGGSLQSTGHLGDVMKESTEIAYTYAKVKVFLCFNLTCMFSCLVSMTTAELSGRAWKHNVEESQRSSSRT